MLPHTVYRIAADTRAFEADDLTGKGAERDGGRWNEPGTPVVYASSSRALACLETVVHLTGPAALPLNRYLVEISIPEALWAARETCDASALTGWDAEPAGRTSMRYGTRWAQGGSSALLVVPSIVVPEEQNVVINPCHPDASRVSAKKVRKWTFDARLRGVS